MSYLYVKSGLGTCVNTDGRLAKQTGGFGSGSLVAANVYASVESCIDNGNVVGGDIICVSDLHSLSDALSHNWQTTESDSGVVIMSVDDANVDAYKKGAQEAQTGTSSDIYVRGRFLILGMTIKAADMFNHNSNNGGHATYWDCDLHILNAGNQLYCGVDGQTVELIDTDLHFEQDNNYIQIINATTFIMRGGKIHGYEGDGFLNYCMRYGAGNGGMRAYFKGVDLSDIDTTLFATAGSDPGVDDMIDIHFDRCQLHASLANWTDEDFASRNQNMLVTRCGSSGAVDYQYYQQLWGGYVEDDTAIYRDGSTAFHESGQKISLKVNTTADAVVDRIEPMRIKFPTRVVDLADAGSDVVRIHLLCADSLTDADVWAEMIYPDGTNKYVPNRVHSVARGLNWMRTGSALATNTEVWTGRTSENRYQIDLDTSGDAGAQCVPEIVLYIAKQTTIYFCPTLDLV